MPRTSEARSGIRAESPRALTLGTLIVTAVYLAVNAAYLAVLPMDAIARSPLVAADVAVRAVRRISVTRLIAALVCVSTFGTMNGGTMCYPRIFYAMAEDRLFFRGIAAVHPRYGTPHASIAARSPALAIGFLWVRTFEQLIEIFILGILPFWALAAGAVIVLRRRRPDLARPYRTPGYPVVPVLFILATIGLLLNSLVARPCRPWRSFAAILVGVPMYYLWRMLSAARSPRHPSRRSDSTATERRLPLDLASSLTGCLLGQALGDALGFVVEARPPAEAREYVEG